MSYYVFVSASPATDDWTPVLKTRSLRTALALNRKNHSQGLYGHVRESSSMLAKEREQADNQLHSVSGHRRRVGAKRKRTYARRR